MLLVGSLSVGSLNSSKLHLEIQHPNRNSFISTNLTGNPSRRCLIIANCSLKNNPQDDEGSSLGVKAALSFLRFYKKEISPILPRSCRYVPTCSEYSMIAYKKYGFVKGTVLTAWRLCRCNPLGGSGFDPPRWFDEEMPSEQRDLWD
ncbi:hypothetical protein K2173_002000 [Erythroxylum novogranatense]|uniref:Uncharacterized protein n=1 Tax=Erythroxylum novogranatense TaxID=1862640 RepID=A0AAV8SP66_9ROSI|nr:hypothetical protein K2173_002000 [Erythroxylum novogranatense]